MVRAAITFLLISSILLFGATTICAEHKYGFKIYTVFASNFKEGFGPDLILIKDDLKKTGYTYFTPINERKLDLRLGETGAIPIPGGSSFAVNPIVLKDKKLYVKIYLTGNDQEFSFYNTNPLIGTLAGQSFSFEDDDSLVLVGPTTRWGALIFVIHQIDL